MMPGRSQETEVRFVGLGQFECFERATGSAQGVISDALVVGRVAVEVVRLTQALIMIF